MKENNEEIEKLLKQNMSYSKIAGLLGISLIDVINYDIKRGSIDTPSNRRRTIKRMFLEDELSIEEIKSYLGLSIVQVKEDLIMMGVDPEVPAILQKKLFEDELGKNKHIFKGKTDEVVTRRLKIANLLFEKRYVRR